MLNGFSMVNRCLMVNENELFSFLHRFFNIFDLVDEHFQIRSDGIDHSLTIRKVGWNEGGEYKCLADGGAKTSATLVVKGSMKI